MNENWFAYEKMSTRTRFQTEAWGNSEMAYYCLSSDTREDKSEWP